MVIRTAGTGLTWTGTFDIDIRKLTFDSESDPFLLSNVSCLPMSNVSVQFPAVRMTIATSISPRSAYLMGPVNPSGVHLKGSIFKSDGEYSFVERGKGCLKNSGSIKSISTTRR